VEILNTKGAYMNRKHLIWILLLVWLGGCAKKPTIQPESKIDKPKYHYLQGMESLEKEEYNDAISSFERAIGINPKYGNGYAGLALTYAKTGQKTKSEKAIKNSFDCDVKTEQMYIVKGRIFSIIQGEKKWLKKAMDSFAKAKELGADDSEVYYYTGIAYQSAKKYESAAAEFRKVIEENGSFVEKADERYKKMQILARVAPGTVVGESIAVMKKITRAELAALLCTEFKIEEVFRRFGVRHYNLTYTPFDTTQFHLPTDIGEHWAKQWVEITLELGVMEVFPDGSFKPGDYLKRYEFAMAIQSILVNLQKDRTMARKYIGETSRFPDVKRDHFAYNAMALSAERGIITPQKLNGDFSPNSTVSGLEALEIIKTFRHKLTINF